MFRLSHELRWHWSNIIARFPCLLILILLLLLFDMVFLLLLPIRLCDILHPHLVLNSSKFHNADDNEYEQQDLDAFYNNLGESLDLIRHHFFLLLFNGFV